MSIKVVGGICYIHGEYDGPSCPQWPTCANGEHNPEFVQLGELRYRQSRELPQLEHSLATTFITLQREKNPAERTRMWSECLRLAVELEKLNNGTTTTTTT